MRPTPRLFCTIGMFVLSTIASATDVSRTPPAVYAEALAGQLTPLAEVLAGREAFPHNKTGGIRLLFERINYRDDAGINYRLYHIVSLATEQSGVEYIESDTYTYDREREDIFLIDAATILPDGRRQTVDVKGAFIQTPQREADNGLYTSDAELQLVFPNVAPDAITEAIVLVRENQPVMPGQFATSVTYGGSWPTFRHRTVLDFPVDFLAGVHAFANGAGVPEPTTDAYAPGRERRTWTRENIQPIAWEESGPGWEFRGSTLWLTTLESWDEVAAWYQQLVADRSDLGPELTALVDQRTAGLTDPREIIDKLTETVANEVRYVGLEFGLAGYQPHSCRDVWDKRYGDCKDKANLLRAMLEHKNIHANLVLLLTRGMGWVEKASPSWHTFNHAIVAVDRGPDGWLFCDPTVKYLPAGSLSLGDLARDVLIVRDGRAQWVTTPDSLDDEIRISADLKLGPDGGLAGWFTYGAAGSDAAYYADYFNGLDSDGRLRALQRYVGDFFSGAEVVDVDYTPVSSSVREMAARAYFVRAPRTAGEQPLTFPYPADWLPDVNTVGERRFPYGTTRRTEAVTVSIALPETWKARSLPASFSATSDTAEFSAEWSSNDGRLTARLAWHPQRAVLAPTEYGAFQRSVRALTSWLEQPAILTPDDSPTAVAAVTARATTLDNFPILPTGAGQLRLIDENYPSKKNRNLRRAALERTLQWFPNDAATVFEARVKLAVMDWDDEGLSDAAFADRVAALLARHGSQVNNENRAWAVYLEAKARWSASKDPAALERLRALAEDVTLSEYRRGWAAEAVGNELAESDPAAAIKFLRVHAEYDSEARDSIVRLIATLFARTRDHAGLHDWITGLARDHAPDADALLAAALDELAGASDGDFALNARADFIDAFAAVVTDAITYPRAYPSLEALRNTLALTTARNTFRRILLARLQAAPPAWWTREPDPALADTGVLIEHIKDRNDAHDAEGDVNAILQLVLHHDDATFADFALYVRWAMWWLQNRHIDDGLLEAFGQAVQQLPTDADEEVLQTWNLYAEWLGGAGRPDEARALYERTFANPHAQDYQKVNATGALGLLEIGAGNIDAALAALHRVEPLHLTHKYAATYLYPAIVLHLMRDEDDTAFELIKLLRQEKTENVAKSAHGVVVPNLLRAAENPEGLRAYWNHRQAWRTAWDRLLADQGVTRTPALPLTLDTDATAIAQRIKQAVDRKDLPGYLRELDNLALTGQWVPMYASDFVRHFATADVFGVPLQHSLYELALTTMGGLAPVDPNFDMSARFWEVAFLTDLGRPEPAAAAARRLTKDAGIDSRIGQGSLQLWVFNTRQSSEALEACAALDTALAGPTSFYDRPAAVESLLAALKARGDLAGQRALVEREIARDGFDSNSAFGRRMQTRLSELTSQNAESVKLTQTINDWRQRHHFEWLDALAPRARDEPRFAALKPPLFEAPAGFSDSEITKLNLLFALDEREPLSSRGTAFYAAAWDLAFIQHDARELSAILQEVAAVEAVPADSRANALAAAVNVLLRNGYDGLAADVAGQPTFQIIREDLRADYARAREALARADAGGDSWEDDALTILKGRPADRFTLTVLRRLVARLAFAGEEERARRLTTGVKDLALDPGLRQSAASLRLELTRLIQNLHDIAGLAALVRDALATTNAPALAPSERVQFDFGLQNSGGMTDDERLAIAWRALNNGETLEDKWPLLLFTLTGARKFAEQEPLFFPDLLTRGLALAPPDAVLAPFVSSVGMGGDIDQAVVRERVLPLLDQFVAAPSAPNYPQTVNAIAGMRAYIALRTSHDRRPPELFDPAQTKSLPRAMLVESQLRFHQSRGHHVEALQIVETLGAQELSDPGNFLSARRELLLAGRNAEIELLDESMREVLTQRQSDFWMTPDRFGVGDWMDVVDVLGAKDMFPDTWFDRATALSGSTLRNNSLRLSQAWWKQDWPAIRAAADTVIAELPTNYDVYYQRAVARHQLGDDRGAREDLRVNLRYSLSSAEYPDALALFRKLAPDEAIETPQ